MPRDKVIHFIAGFLAGIPGIWFPCLLCLGVFIGAAKEAVYDFALKKGTPDIMDFIATCAGNLLFIGILCLWRAL